MAGAYTSFDAGRGCPFQCSFCTIINVQGRKSRHRTPDDVEEIIRINAAQNIQRFFITDDDFARNKNWEAILDRMIWLREEQGFKFKVTLQVDTLCHRLEGFIEKAARGGCARVFIGLENIDPDALASAKKRQNKIWEYRKMLQAWKDAGVITYAGYILGFPNDTPEKIARNIEIIQREMPLDLIEFFFPLPFPALRTTRFCTPRACGWTPTSTNTTSITGSRTIRSCPTRRGRRSISTPGGSSIRLSTSRPCSGATRRAASAPARSIPRSCIFSAPS
jgi:radical SAM superfamily enzyme YgiQ (UPF0313 family)